MIHTPSAVCQIATGLYDEQSRHFEEWPGGKVLVKKGGEWVAHDGWPKGEHDYVTEFRIRLRGNVIPYMFQTHLECRPGLRAFCFRAHRQFDQPGICQRVDADGMLRYCECDPGRCALYQQYVSGGEAQVIAGEYAKLYPYADLINKKTSKAAKCKPLNHFIFTLLDRTGKPAHSELDCCILTTHSNRTHGKISQYLQDAFIATHGKLDCLELVLQYEPFTSQHSSKKMKSSWILAAPPGTDLAQSLAQMHATSQALPPGADSTPDSTALVRRQDELAMTNDVEASEAQRQLQWQRVQAECIDPRNVKLINHDPLVMALSERLGLSYQWQVSLQMRYNSARGAVLDMVKWAAQKQVYVDDLLKAHSFTIPKVPLATPTVKKSTIVDDQSTIELPDPAEMAAAAKGEIVDAEFTEVKE